MIPSHNRPPARPSTELPLQIANFKPIALQGGVSAGSLSTDAIFTGENQPIVDVSAKIAELAKRCWTIASVSNNAARSGLQLGASS